MNISGVYGNGGTKEQKLESNIAKAPDKISSVVKKDVEIRTITTASDTDSSIYEEQLLKSVDSNSKEEEIVEVAEEDRWKKNADRMSEEDYEAMSEEDSALEDYNIERLDRALIRIKGQRIIDKDNLEGQKERIEEKVEAVKSSVNYNGATQKIVEKLIEADLPVTEENIVRIANAMEMAATATQMSDRAMNYLIKNKLEPTIENIYKAQFSGNYSQSKEVSEENWNGLQGQVNDIINSAGLETSAGNLESAKWLLNHQLPLTENTLWALRDLNLIKNSTEEEVLGKALQAITAGTAPEAASLGLVGAERIEQTIAMFLNISSDAIELAVSINQNEQTEPSSQINCIKLVEAQKIIDEQEVNDPKLTDIQTITVRRQLEEIRLKMTLDVGQQLTKNGFHLETDGLSKIVDGLKEIEDQYYHNLLKERNVPVNNENLETLKDSIQGIDDLKSTPNYILGSTLSSRRVQTISGLLVAGVECKQTLNKANEAYEALMTSPRADMGDSISKAFRNVDAILEDMKLETNKANERAVRILGYNAIEITEENIQQVKSYDEQVNHMMKNLHPAVTVELIKKGLNPLNIPIEELNLQIDEIKSELGVSDEEKYSKYLWKLENKQGITEQEKKSYIGIYRLLNAVEKTDGAALGAVIKAEQEVTMNNLLTAVRTIKSGGIRASVDDSFGSLEQLTYTRERISDQVESAFQTAPKTSTMSQDSETSSSVIDKFDYINSLLQNVMDKIEPNKLQSLGKTKDIMNMSVERLQETMLEVPDDNKLNKTYWSEKLDTYQKITEHADNAIQFLNDLNIPSSMNNIQAANDALSDNQFIYKQWKNLLEQKRENSSGSFDMVSEPVNSEVSTMSEDIINAFTNRQSMIDQYQKMEKDTNKRLDLFYENPVITSQDITTLQRISNGMSFLKTMAKRENFEIPIAVGDKITNVNVTILRNTEETGKVNINMTSEKLGKISASLTVKELGVKGLITCDNRFGLEAIQSVSDDIEDAITQVGVEMRQMNYAIENNRTDMYQYKNLNPIEELDSESIEDEKTVSTNKLYSIAKALLIQIKTVEIKYM